MSDVNDESAMIAELLKYGGLREVWGGIEWKKGVELFDPFGVNSMDPFSEDEARECEAKLKTDDAKKRSKIANDKQLMYLVYLKLVCVGIDRVEWTCVKREGFITQVRGTCDGASLAIVVYPEKYSFKITATMSSGSVKEYQTPVYTFTRLVEVVKKWRSAVARMTQ